MMAFGGNNRAHAFFKQHGWTDGGKIEAKYTSRASELYRQLLTKEVAKSTSEDLPLPSSPVASQNSPEADFIPETKVGGDLLDEVKVEEPRISGTARSPKAPQSTVFSSIKKPMGGKKTGCKSGGLGARKLTAKVGQPFEYFSLFQLSSSGY